MNFQKVIAVKVVLVPQGELKNSRLRARKITKIAYAK
jgi:hypothetical protein